MVWQLRRGFFSRLKFPKKKKGIPRKILLIVDLENLLVNITLPLVPTSHQPTLPTALNQLVQRLKKMGEVLGPFIFCPSHLVPGHEKVFHEHGFFLIHCPKTQSQDGKKDTVDETIIRFSENLLPNLLGLTHFCLASGDADFLPLLKEIKKAGIKIIIAAGNLSSLANQLIAIAELDGETKKRRVLIYPFDK